jgi:epoxyqueuosine reductase
VKTTLKTLARTSGFERCTVAAAQRAPHAVAYRAWLDSGWHGEMSWLARNPARRSDPALVLPGARSIVLLAKSYFQGATTRQIPGRVARYAWGEDYHQLMLDSMQPLLNFLAEQGGAQRAYVDTGPVLERDFAAVSGLGWHGKSTMLLNQELGTWFFIGCILTTIDLEPDPPVKPHCGRCTRCIDACPTGAISEPFRLDARRCISYQTIENKGSIPEELRPLIGDRIYGCDDCLEACPWNRFAEASRETRFYLKPEFARMPLGELAELTEERFRELFRRSPIKRIKRNRFVRNVCVALGNVGDASDLPVLKRLANDSDPLIAEHATWAVAEIGRRLTADSASVRR